MLKRLLIRNIVLVEKADIPFAAGLNVLSGETGAGKSILLDALGLVLGDRSDAALVRSGAAQASVTAEFLVESNPEIAAFLLTIGIEPEEMLIVRRVVDATGKSRAFVNDVSVTVALLKQLAALLVKQHSQHDQRSLCDPIYQRDMVDALAVAASERDDCSVAYRQWKQARDAYDALLERAKETQRERAYLAHMVDELAALKPKPDEEATLAEQRIRMQQQAKVYGTLNEIITVLRKPSDVVQQLAAAHRMINKSVPESLDGYAHVQEGLDRAWQCANEAVEQIERWCSDVPDEQSLDSAEERLFALRDLARKYRLNVDGLHDALQEARGKFQELDMLDQHCDTAAKEIEITRARYIESAAALTRKRDAVVEVFAASMRKELKPLKMEKAQVVIQRDALPEAQWGEAGVDRLTLCASTNPGLPLVPLSECASGGELSRVMLALTVVLATVDRPAVYVFDEIDTGTGGAVAEAIGVRLNRLASRAQVLVVTHAPQVAAQGDQHLLICKHVEKGQTFTDITLLSMEARRDELARMLSGATVTDAARSAASQLLEAGALKSGAMKASA